jgi:hypothetical protein
LFYSFFLKVTKFLLSNLACSGRNDLHLTVRGLHKHVLWCITQPLTAKDVVALRDGDEIETTPIQSTGGTENVGAVKSPTSIERQQPITNSTINTRNESNEAKYGTFDSVSCAGATQVDSEPQHPTDEQVCRPLPSPPKEDTSLKNTVPISSKPKPSSIPLPKEAKEEKSSKIFELQSVMEMEIIPQPTIRSVSSLQNDKAQPDTPRIISAKERLGGYLHPRDMRRLVSPFSASNEPDVIVRRHVMLLNFDPLRAIILRDRLLVIVPRGADSLLVALEQRVRGGAVAFANLVLGKPSSFDESDIGDGKKTDTPPIKKSTIVQSILHKALDIKLSSSSGNEMGEKNATQSDKSMQRKPSDVASTVATSLYDDAGEWDDIHNSTTINLPFELLCVDSVLHIVTRILMDDTYRLQRSAYECILDEGLGRRASEVRDGTIIKARKKKSSMDPLIAIRLMKDTAAEMTSRVDRFVKSMNRILDRDEDMALMNLSRLITHPDRFVKPVEVAVLNEELDEPQLMLEAHLQVGLTLENALNLLQGQLSTSTELLGQKLTAISNRILFANMVISVISLCVAMGSFVGSIFGMNVTNFYETSEYAFRIITFSTLVGGFLLGGAIMLVLVLSGTVPTTGLSDEF